MRIGVRAPVFGLALGITKTAGAAGPRDWQLGFSPAGSQTMARIMEFHDLLLVIIAAITGFVVLLLLFVIYRFSEKRNPIPAKTTHNTVIEVLWTTVPVILLAVIAIPSFKLLYYVDRVEDADMTIKAIGNQWYWSYVYPDHGNFTFDAVMVPEEDVEDAGLRLLETDNPVVLPVDTKIRVLVTASAVLHSFAVPALGLKLDANPGQVNETWVQIDRVGTYYGQCSEICGIGHSFMPIAIKAVSRRDFEEWVESAKDNFAQLDEPGERALLAQAPGVGFARVGIAPGSTRGGDRDPGR